MPLIYYGCIQAVHKSTVAAPTWTKWRFAKGLAMYEAAIQQPIRKTAVLNRRPAFVACWQLDGDITKSNQERRLLHHRGQTNAIKLREKKLHKLT